MNLPCFFTENISATGQTMVLDEDSSRHIVQVLRLKKGAAVQLTDGKGHLLTTEIINDHKKAAEVRVLSAVTRPGSKRQVAIGISLIKNASRFEWFLEKATEIGVNEIIPLICERTEKQHFRIDRMRNILVSAMLQSRQAWLPRLQEPVHFANILSRSVAGQRFIAHCVEEEKRSLREIADMRSDVIVLIGPEGDFTLNEIERALLSGYKPVLLGETRLRTETAGIVAATLLKLE